MTSYGYNLDVARQKVTLYLDPMILRQLRVAAARRGVKDSELVEEAVKEHIGLAAFERLQAAAAPLIEGKTEDEVLQWVVDVQHELRQAH